MDELPAILTEDLRCPDEGYRRLVMAMYVDAVVSEDWDWLLKDADWWLELAGIDSEQIREEMEGHGNSG